MCERCRRVRPFLRGAIAVMVVVVVVVVVMVVVVNLATQEPLNKPLVLRWLVPHLLVAIGGWMRHMHSCCCR